MKAYKFRIYPNTDQQERINKHFGCVRHIFNWALEREDKHCKETQKSLSKSEIQSLLVQSKKEDKPWLQEVNSQSLLSALLPLETAFTNFFKGRANTQSFQCPQHVSVDFDVGLLYLPKFKTGIKTKFHRPLKGEIKTITIKRKPSGKFYASTLVDEAKAPFAPIVLEQTLGIDLGLTHFLVDSEGEKVENPGILKQALNKLATAQKRWACQVKGSKNYQKQKLNGALIYEKAAPTRLDFLHKISAKWVYKNHATRFALEDLNIKGMVKNRKLSKVISEVSWGKFVELLTYKSLWVGKNVLRIGRFEPRSKLCNACGYKVDKLPLYVRHWACPACGAALDRDISAAQNVKKIALADALGQSVCVKRSPETLPVSAGVSARGVDVHRHGSQEAPTTAAIAV